MALCYKTSKIKINETELTIRHFEDRNQFPTVDEQVDIGERSWGRDVPESLWPLVGTIWPSGVVLAEAIAKMPLRDKRILEIGCGLGLSSLIAHRDGRDITASDYNPFAETLLKENARLNGLTPVKFLSLSFEDKFKGHPFDLIVASDIMYEPGCGAHLIEFLKASLDRNGEAIFVDPGRAHVGKFESELRRQGLSCQSDRPVAGEKIRLLTIRFSN